MEPLYTSPQQRDASPSRIPHAQQQQDQVVTRMVDMDSRLAEKLSRSTAGLSPSRIPGIAPPSAAADKSLVPTGRRKHHDVADSHQHKRLQPAPLNSRTGHGMSLPDKLPQQNRLPRVLKSQQDNMKVKQQRQQSDSLEPWEPQADLAQQLPQHPQQTAPQQQQQYPAGQQTLSPGQHQQLQGRFPVPRNFQVQEQQQHTTLPRIKQKQQQSPSRQPHIEQHGVPPSQDPSQQQHAHATAANSGWAASRKLHDFLLSQQRRKEAYWLNKYGRVLGPTAPESLGRPSPNPASMFRHPAAQMLSPSHSSNLLSRAGSHPLKLPVIPNSHSKTSLAAENSAQLDHAIAFRAAEGGGPSSGRSTAKSSVHGDIHGNSSSILAGRRQSQHTAAQPVDSMQQRQQQQHDETDDAAFEQIKAKITLAAVPKLSVTTTLSKPVLPGTAAGSAISGRSTPRRQLPLRDLEAELQVLKAIKCREDAVDKLRSCCARLGGAVGADSAASMLLPTDPLGRLFYRLVSNLRLKTLDVIEAHAAWQRKVSGPPEPFTYRGKPYLPCMGGDLGFLDAAPWLAGRLLRCKAVEDCLLVELTADGIPIDDVTSFDMRRGPSHFSAEALRIRMARKVLAAAGVQQPPATASSITAALQQQHQQQQLLQEGSSSQLQRAAQPEVQSPSTTVQQQQHEVAMSAVTAALGILRRSSADGGDSGDTVSNTAADIWDQHDARTQDSVQMDDRISTSSRPSRSRVASRVGSSSQLASQLEEPQQQDQGHMSPPASMQSPASLQQQQQPPPSGEPWLQHPPAQEQLEMRPQLTQQVLNNQQIQHRHTDSVVDDLLTMLVTQMQDDAPLGPQQQVQHTAVDDDDLSVGLEANADYDRGQPAMQNEQQPQEQGQQLHQHQHTVSVVDDLLNGLVADAEQARPQSVLWDERQEPKQGRQRRKHQHTDSVVDEMLDGLVHAVEQAEPDSVQRQHQQQLQQTGLGNAVMCGEQPPTSIATGGHGAAKLAVTGSLEEPRVVEGRGSSNRLIDSMLDSLVDDIEFVV